jgi:hypothetical protein
MIVACCLIFVSCTFCSLFRQHNSVVLQHTSIRRVIGEQRSYAVEIMNGRYMRHNQITYNNRHSWVGLGPIYHNRVYLVTYLSCIALFSIENAEDRRAMYDGFSEKGGHLTEQVQIIKNFLNQAFPGGRRVVKCPCKIC